MADNSNQDGLSLGGSMAVSALGGAAATGTGLLVHGHEHGKLVRAYAKTDEGKAAIEKLMGSDKGVRQAVEIRNTLTETHGVISQAGHAKFSKIDPSSPSSKWKTEWTQFTKEIPGTDNAYGKKASFELSWDELPKDVREHALKKGGAHVEFSGEKIPKTLRQDVLDSHLLPKIEKADTVIEGALAKDLKGAGKNLGHGMTGTLVKAGIAGLLVGGAAYLALKPKSWTERIDQERTAKANTVDSPTL